jgi:hypothetical protein
MRAIVLGLLAFGVTYGIGWALARENDASPAPPAPPPPPQEEALPMEAVTPIETPKKRNLGRRLFGSKKRTALTILALLALAITTVAIAAWLSTANGQGRGKGGHLNALTIAAPTASDLVATSSSLFPGTDGELYVKVTNPNTRAMYATSVNGTGASVVSDGPAACPSTNVTVNASTTYAAADNVGNALQVPANAVGVLLPLPRVLHMDPAAPNGCQDMTFLVGATAPPAVTFSTVAP